MSDSTTSTTSTSSTSSTTSTSSTSSTTSTTTETGDELAQAAGYSDAAAYISALQSQISSSSATTSNNGKNAAAQFVTSLLRLVLYQEIKADYNLTKYNWINRFDDEKIEVGDGKEYIKNVITGVDDYNVDTFNPSAATQPKSASGVIRLYTDDSTETLNDYAFKKIKPLTILENNGFPYFMSGKLQEFIAKQVDLMKKSLFFYKYQVFSSLLSDLVTNSDNSIYTMTGTATNIQTCFVNEIFPLIEAMQYFDNQYAINSDSNGSFMTQSNKEDLLMIMNRNTLNRFKNGVLANVLMSKLVDFNNILPLENIIGTGKTINVGGSGDNIQVGTDELVPENKVLIINKNALKYLGFVEVSESQRYVTNLSIQYVIHLWGVFGTIPGEQAAIYTNDNLETLPLSTSTT